MELRCSANPTSDVWTRVRMEIHKLTEAEALLGPCRVDPETAGIRPRLLSPTVYHIRKTHRE